MKSPRPRVPCESSFPRPEQFSAWLGKGSFRPTFSYCSAPTTNRSSKRLRSEITPTTGAVREFVSPAGAVFGVAWEGQFPPNFQLLLGPYYQQVQQAIAQQASEQPTRRRRGPVMIETPGIVFSQGGHMRSFHGQAYIPQLVPQGVQTSDIR